MCGRFQLKEPEDWVEEFGLTEAEAPSLPARYNIAPTQDIVVIRRDSAGRRRAGMMRWGLLPPEGSAEGRPLINARAETVATRGVFRNAFRRRRCLVPAHGFYEWRRLGRTRQPYLIRRRDGSPFAFAGLWEPGKEDAGGSCTLVTTEANPIVAPIHDRMPVLLDRGSYDLWLDLDAPPAALTRLLGPCPPEDLEAFPVSTRVNSADVDDPECERRVLGLPEVPAQASLFEE